MTRRYRDFLISHDGMQWVVQKEYMGKDKNGDDKIMKATKSYFSRLGSVAVHIGNSELVDSFQLKCNSVFDKLKIEFESDEEGVEK